MAIERAVGLDLEGPGGGDTCLSAEVATGTGMPCFQRVRDLLRKVPRFVYFSILLGSVCLCAVIIVGLKGSEHFVGRDKGLSLGIDSTSNPCEQHSSCGQCMYDDACVWCKENFDETGTCRQIQDKGAPFFSCPFYDGDDTLPEECAGGNQGPWYKISGDTKGSGQCIRSADGQGFSDCSANQEDHPLFGLQCAYLNNPVFAVNEDSNYVNNVKPLAVGGDKGIANFNDCLRWRDEFNKYYQPLEKPENPEHCWPGIHVGRDISMANRICGPLPRDDGNDNWYYCEDQPNDNLPDVPNYPMACASATCCKTGGFWFTGWKCAPWGWSEC